MKKLICLVLFLFSANAFAANSSGNVSNVLSIGGISAADNLTIPEGNSQGYFTIGCYFAGTTGGHYYPCGKTGSQYQVTAGKTFNAVKVCLLNSGTSNSFNVMNATASFAQDAASVTGGVYLGPGATTYPFYTATTANTYACYNVPFTAASGTYVGIQFSTSSMTISAFIIGKEI